MKSESESQSILSIIKHNGRKISYIERGFGTTIVLLPPGASPASAWRNVTDELNSRFKTIAVNPSGYAETESFNNVLPMALSDEASAVMAVLSDNAEPTHLVGHSYGGAIALHLALMWPTKFKSLTLIEPASYPLLRQAGEDVLATEVEDVNFRYIERVQAGDSESAFKSYYDYYNGKEGSLSRLPLETRRILLSYAGTLAITLTAIHSSPIQLHECTDISIPTMLVRGSHTDRIHSGLTDLLAKKIPKSQLKIVDGAGHMLTLTHSANIAQLIIHHTNK